MVLTVVVSPLLAPSLCDVFFVDHLTFPIEALVPLADVFNHRCQKVPKGEAIREISPGAIRGALHFVFFCGWYFFCSVDKTSKISQTAGGRPRWYPETLGHHSQMLVNIFNSVCK